MEEEGKMDQSHKLLEEISKLQVVSCSLEQVRNDLKPCEDHSTYGKIWGAQLIVEEVAKNLIAYNEEFLED